MSFFDYESDGSSQQSSEHLTVFDNLSTEDWQVVIANGQRIDFSKGQTLLKQGDVDDALYIVISGKVEVVAGRTFGGDKRLALIDEGSVFGELSFFDSRPRSASVKGASDGNALRLSRKGFDKIAAWNPALARQFLLDLGRILAFRFRTESPVRI